eukprot:TRINITY_DN62949_c0_g1_i1.p1 TRINITY_DN62949_c0_g1~~TRINITY_DN62949_c0_g1_i1.p1  ORF type:complete len:276 (-),score=48.07 TRINITY_DN62949_c0_g1_i1:14-805(-)
MFWNCCSDYAQEVDKKDPNDDVDVTASTVALGITDEAVTTGADRSQPSSEESSRLLDQMPVVRDPSAQAQESDAQAGPLVTLIEEGGESDITLQSMYGVSLGCELDTEDDDFCMVSSVAVKGLVDRWNRAHPKREQRLQVYDRIVEVACQSGPSANLEAVLHNETRIKYQTQVRYQRPRIQELRINSNDGALGLEFDGLVKGTSLPIVKVLEGNVHKAVSEAGLKAAQKSRIVAVNGEFQLAPSKIMEMMQAEEFKITVCSYN